jgi:hypothetical protein
MAVSLAAACSRSSKPANPGCCDTTSTIDAAARGRCRDVDSGQADALAASSPRESAAAEVASAAVVVEERFVASDGCAKDLRSKGSIERNIAELGRLCAQGMTPMADAVRATEPVGGAIEMSFLVGARSVCLRIGATASAGELTLTLSGPRGEPLASVRSNDPLGLLPTDGPYCVREAGTYRATAQLTGGAPEGADVVLQVWHTVGPASGARQDPAGVGARP